MGWVTMVAGVLLFVAPFVLGYSGTPAALWTSLAMGAAIAFVGFRKLYKWAAGLGLLTFVAPFVLGFSRTAAALWSCLILGAVVAVLAGYSGFFAKRGQSGDLQQRQA